MGMTYTWQVLLIVVGLVALGINLALLSFASGERDELQPGTWQRIAATGTVRRKTIKGIILCTFLYEVVSGHLLTSGLVTARYLLLCADVLLTFASIVQIDRLRRFEP